MLLLKKEKIINIKVGDRMDLTYVLSQICAIIAVILLGITYCVKDKKIVLLLAISFATFYGIQYLLLNAITGFFMNLVSIIRNIWFYINYKNKRKNSIFVLISLFIITITLGLISYKDIFSILPIIATLIYTYSIWQDDIKLYRWLAIPMSLSWLGYNIYSRTLFGVINECILLIVEIIGIIRIKKQKN